MMIQLLHNRLDGSFVISIDNLPYHAVQSDPLWVIASAMFSGIPLAGEPAPRSAIIAPSPLQWLDRLTAQQQAIILDTLDSTSEGRRVQKRILSSPSIDVLSADVDACLTLLADVLTPEDAALLRA